MLVAAQALVYMAARTIRNEEGIGKFNSFHNCII